jgi:hypothetical protein
MRPIKMGRDPSYLLVLAAAIFAGFAIARNQPGPAEATHFLGEHALNFHGCGPQVTYSNTTFSPGVVSQATMDGVFNLAFESGYGWDSNCGNKIARGTAYNQAYIGPTDWVNGYCGGPAWGCIVRSAGP